MSTYFWWRQHIFDDVRIFFWILFFLFSGQPVKNLLRYEITTPTEFSAGYLEDTKIFQVGMQVWVLYIWSLYFSIFSSPLLWLLKSPGTAISMIVNFRIAFSTKIISGRLLCATVMSVWIVRYQYNSTSIILHDISRCMLIPYAHTVHASCTIPNELFWQHCHFFFCTVSAAAWGNLHLLLGETGCLSIFALIKLILSALSLHWLNWFLVPAPELQITTCLLSLSFFKNPFLIHFPENSCAMFLVVLLNYFYYYCYCYCYYYYRSLHLAKFMI